jgi:hypothetical protein
VRKQDAKKIAAEHRWYEGRFGKDGFGTGKRRYTEAEKLDALNARDAVIFRQRREILRLRAKVKVEAFLRTEIEAHVREKHNCDFICQHVTTIAPIETPLFSMAEKTKAPGTIHEWMVDKRREYSLWARFKKALDWVADWNWMVISGDTSHMKKTEGDI